MSTTTDIPVRSAESQATVRPESIPLFQPRAHADAEARARADAIAAWERLYGEPLPWHGTVSERVVHTPETCSVTITVEPA